MSESERDKLINEKDREPDAVALALLKILELGEKEIAEGKVMLAGEVFERLRRKVAGKR